MSNHTIHGEQMRDGEQLASGVIAMMTEMVRTGCTVTEIDAAVKGAREAYFAQAREVVGQATTDILAY
ncbi:hypothetical protein KJ596_03460 [Patescibacteria group bacterium]|nr:hypothetical protein [Patescibacteria group bacterium]MBU1868040.1 hypothetical protein [Patescibacteria group bacterium]